VLERFGNKVYSKLKGNKKASRCRKHCVSAEAVVINKKEKVISVVAKDLLVGMYVQVLSLPKPPG
jgi:hypothetical protein